MESIIIYLKANEESLMERILSYAMQHGYTQYTSTLKEAWRISIEGITASIISAMELSPDILELSPNDDYRHDPVSRFGVIEAKKHRERGISFSMFLGLFKYYRQCYQDLLNESDIEEELKDHAVSFIARCFDRIEIAFCTEWARLDTDQTIIELQSMNRGMTNEKNRYLTIFESIDTPVVIVDTEGLAENFNFAAAALFTDMGIPGEYYYRESKKAVAENNNVPEKLSDKASIETLLPFIADDIRRAMSENPAPAGFETETEIKGILRHFQVTISRQLDVSGKFTGLIITLNDISDLKQYQSRLRESEQKYRALFENSIDAISVVDMQTGKIDFVNPAACKLFGYSENEFMQLTILDVSAEKKKTRKRIKQMQDGTPTLTVPERSFLKKDGSSFIGEVCAAVFEDANQKKKINISFRNITHRKQYERELIKSERKFRMAFERSRDAIFWADAETGVIIECNEAAEKLMEYSREELIGMHQRQLHPAEEHEKYLEEFSNHVDEKGAEDVEATISTKSGKEIPVHISSTITVMDGILINQGVFRNVSSIKQFEAALLESEAKYRELVQSARSIIIKLDRDGNFTFFNEYAQEFFGYTENEVIGKNVLGTIVPEVDSTGADLKNMISDEFSNPKEFIYNENENMRKDGSRVWISWSNRMIYDNEGNFTGMLCCGTDHTQRRKAEEQLRVLAVAVEQSANAIFITDPEGVIQMVNSAFEKLTGYSREEAIGQKPSILKSGYHENDFYSRMWNKIKSGKSWTGIMRNQKKNGKLYWEESTTSPVFNDRNEITHFIQIKDDITERKESEEKIRELLSTVQAQRDELESFAYMISHDLKAPLITIEGFSEALVEEYGEPADSDARHYMTRIFESARKMRTMMNDILEYSRVGIREQNIEDISFQKLVWDCLEDKKIVIRKKNITPSVTGIDAVIRAERTRIYEIFDNLISNAIKYCEPETGVPEIEIGAECADSGIVSFYVLDNGKGIPEPELEKVFKLFFRSPSATTQDGSGVGLAIVQRIINQYDGSVEAVRNDPEPGVTIRFNLGRNANPA